VLAAAVGVVYRRPIGAVVTVQRVRRRLQMSRLDSTPAMWLRHHPLRGVDSVHLQILLMGTCRQCGLWPVAGHNHVKVIG